MPKNISQLLLSTTPNSLYVIPSDNSSGTATEKVTIKQINDLSRTYSVLSLGTVSGVTNISFGADRLIQSLTLNGTAVQFTKGSGWPSSNDIAADIVLNISVASTTSITWSVVDTWIINPPAGALGVDNHVVLLRSIGSSIQGFYVGN
jgi:hypothetical protein